MDMGIVVNVHEAKTQFSKLLAKVGKGGEIIIAKAGKPVARLVPIEERPLKRSPGSARGKVVISKDFDAPLPAKIMELFDR
jgi:prevent-host-death family protein